MNRKQSAPKARVVALFFTASAVAVTALWYPFGSAARSARAEAAGSTVARSAFLKDYARPASVPFPKDNPFTPERRDLGHKLFFDPRLSASSIMSCATCHNPSFSWGDNLALGVGHNMKQLGRRTPTIINAGFIEPLMWDGRFDTLEDQAMGPITSAAEMNMTPKEAIDRIASIPEYQELFAKAYPGEGITPKTIAKSIATFERTVVSADAPFDQYVKGDDAAISDAAKRGFQLFNTTANCVKCHSGWNFTDNSFHDIGVASDDIGRAKQIPLPSMQHAFKTPGLRNIAGRAPFTHNGSEKTLEDIVELYNLGGREMRASISPLIKPLNLTSEEKKDLVAFLQTLSSNDAPISLPRLPTGAPSANPASPDVANLPQN